MNDAEQFRDMLAVYGGAVGKPSRKIIAFLRQKGVSEAGVLYISDYILKKAAPVSAIHFYGERGVMDTNADGFLPIAVRDGLLIVGSCPNGDPVVVDLRDQLGAVGYLGHETMWDVANVREVFVVLAQGLGEFAAGLRAEAMPLDYYAAIRHT